MNYKLSTEGNDFISVSFNDDIEIDARIYSTISHNPAIMIPGIRNHENANTINYDTLGSISILDELKQSTYDRQSLYGLFMNMLNVLEKIFALGISEQQVVFDCAHIYVSLFDKSVRFICLPVCSNNITQTVRPADMFKIIALTVKSNGAYELLGYVIEKTAAGDFSITEFKNGLIRMFEKAEKSVGQDVKTKSPGEDAVNANTGNNTTQRSAVLLDDSAGENVYSGREYVPSGIPFAYSGDGAARLDTIDPDKRTQVLFAGIQELGDIPYISPIDNNSPEARIYIAGEKLTIGRSSENDLHINVSTVSGKHAELHRSGDGCTIIDLNSTNKTYVNGIAIKPNIPIRLKHQDLIAFNKSRYRYFDH